eukprot:TRINITY_DN4486_c0_g2_i3.p1 TRINITY_DN4486_c0_g2~~TRINITY_DN4486_c0_g2_i3.p1  ORF type:complete len:713 (-),score=90.89 TRINITY_DN4486_c0_g2_i3:196-2334(-)
MMDSFKGSSPLAKDKSGYFVHRRCGSDWSANFSASSLSGVPFWHQKNPSARQITSPNERTPNAMFDSSRLISEMGHFPSPRDLNHMSKVLSVKLPNGLGSHQRQRSYLRISEFKGTTLESLREKDSRTSSPLKYENGETNQQNKGCETPWPGYLSPRFGQSPVLTRSNSLSQAVFPESLIQTPVNIRKENQFFAKKIRSDVLEGLLKREKVLVNKPPASLPQSKVPSPAKTQDDLTKEKPRLEYFKLPARRPPKKSRSDSFVKEKQSKSQEPLRKSKTFNEQEFRMLRRRSRGDDDQIAERVQEALCLSPAKRHTNRLSQVLGIDMAPKDSKMSTSLKTSLPSLQLLTMTSSFMTSKEDTKAISYDGNSDLRSRLINEISNSFKTIGKPPVTTTEYYSFKQQIGKGAFGKVYYAVETLTGRPVAVKAFDKRLMASRFSKRRIFEEVLMLKSLAHHHIVKVFELFQDEETIFLVMEYVDGGDLLKIVRSRKRFTEAEARPIFRQIVSAVQYLHANNVLHRDLKLDNILVDSNKGIVKLADFGVSKKMRPGKIIHEECGTPAFMAPEQVRKEGYEGMASDIWSLGVVLYSMTSGTLPFKSKDTHEQRELILKGKFKFRCSLSPSLMHLISGMLQVDPARRMTIEHVSRHPWLNSPKPSENEISSPSNTKLSIPQEDLIATLNSLGYPIHYIQRVIQSETLSHAKLCYQLLQKED